MSENDDKKQILDGFDTSDFDFEVASVSSQRSHREEIQTASRLNSFLGYAVAAIIFLSAIPAASNRPIFWLFWSGVILLLFAVYMALSNRFNSGRPLRVSVDRQWVAPAIGLAFIVGVFLQTIPFGLSLSEPMETPLGTISLMPEASRLGLLRVLGYIAFFVLVLEVSARQLRVTRIAWLIFIAVALHALWAMISLKFLGDAFFWGEKSAYKGVATGTFINRNSFATFLGMGFILGLALLWDVISAPRVRKAASTAAPKASVLDIALPGIGLVLIAMTLIETQSRMGLFATFVASALTFFILQVKSGRNPLFQAAIVVGITAVLIGALIGFLGEGLFDRMVFVEQNSDTRSLLWSQVWEMIKDRPLTGFGWDGFWPAFEHYHQLPLSSDFVWDRAHSTYLTLWSEAGLLLGSLPMIATAVIGWRLVRQVWSSDTNYFVAVAAIGAVVQCIIHSAVDFSLEIPANMYLFVAVLGLGSATRRKQRSST